jgi:uncharacterized repeat protein (TIGR03803 family)
MYTVSLDFQAEAGTVEHTRRGWEMMRAQGNRGWAAMMVTPILVMLAGAIGLPAQTAVTFATLHSFGGTDGNLPAAAPVQGPDGNFYGTTSGGGTNTGVYCPSGCGTVFKINPSGKLTTLYSFCAQPGCADGDGPIGGLVLGLDGNFYGTTGYGGANYSCSGGCGTVFKITSTGVVTTLHSFEGSPNDGGNSFAALVLGADGSFYGTTNMGGSNNSGTVFRVTPGGTLTLLHSFDSSDGAYVGSPLILGIDGNFYGTAYGGGAAACGTVFRINPSGLLTVLHSFSGTDGKGPSGALVQGANGNFYGTTYYGGGNNTGTAFEITPAGALTTLYVFNGIEGASPSGALVQATDANLYGTTQFGGTVSSGTVFKITAQGALLTLHSFDTNDGSQPAGLIQATTGNFYGATRDGGTNSDGTVFALSVGLGPFAQTVPAFGKVGTTIWILGNHLTGATRVTFNGMAASYTVISATAIKATVPVGATTGPVQVVTPGGTLTSNVPFRVRP